jgi:RHS repeat-associated protein
MDGHSYTIQYQNNQIGQGTQITYSSGRVVASSYDSSGRLSSITEPVNAQTGAGGTYFSDISYSPAGLVTAETLGDTVPVSEAFGYDSQRLQLTSQTATRSGGSTGGLMNLHYSYQAAAGQMGINTTAGNAGQLMAINNSSTINGSAESAAYTYDLQARLVTSSQTTNGISAQRRFAYDRWANRTEMWDATSGGNQIQNVGLQQSGGVPTNAITTVSSAGESVYNTPGQCGTPTTINVGRTGRYVRVQLMGTNYLHLAEVQVIGSSGQNLAVGKTATQSSTAFGGTANRANDGNTDGIFADGSVSHTNFENQPWWQVDLGSSQQITSVNVWNRTDCCQSRTTNFNVIVSDQPITTMGYIYDAAGNVTYDGVHSYQYDAENRTSSADNGATGSYAYEYQNRRYKKTIGSTVTHYIWEGNQVLAEHSGSTGAQIVDYVYAGGKLIGEGPSNILGGNGTFTYLLSDRLSTRVSLDRYGNILGRQATLPFGEEFGESGTQEKHHFTTYESDPETATDYAVNRQYAQGVGRFMRVDPVAESPENPQSLDAYTYVLADPVNGTDPNGLLWRNIHSPADPINRPNPGVLIIRPPDCGDPGGDPGPASFIAFRSVAYLGDLVSFDSAPPIYFATLDIGGGACNGFAFTISVTYAIRPSGGLAGVASVGFRVDGWTVESYIDAGSPIKLTLLRKTTASRTARLKIVLTGQDDKRNRLTATGYVTLRCPKS